MIIPEIEQEGIDKFISCWHATKTIRFEYDDKEKRPFHKGFCKKISEDITIFPTCNFCEAHIDQGKQGVRQRGFRPKRSITETKRQRIMNSRRRQVQRKEKGKNTFQKGIDEFK